MLPWEGLQFIVQSNKLAVSWWVTGLFFVPNCGLPMWPWCCGVIPTLRPSSSCRWFVVYLCLSVSFSLCAPFSMLVWLCILLSNSCVLYFLLPPIFVYAFLFLFHSLPVCFWLFFIYTYLYLYISAALPHGGNVAGSEDRIQDIFAFPCNQWPWTSSCRLCWARARNAPILVILLFLITSGYLILWRYIRTI